MKAFPFFNIRVFFYAFLATLPFAFLIYPFTSLLDVAYLEGFLIFLFFVFSIIAQDLLVSRISFVRPADSGIEKAVLQSFKTRMPSPSFHRSFPKILILEKPEPAVIFLRSLFRRGVVLITTGALSDFSMDEFEEKLGHILRESNSSEWPWLTFLSWLSRQFSLPESSSFDLFFSSFSFQIHRLARFSRVYRFSNPSVTIGSFYEKNTSSSQFPFLV